MKMLKNLMLVSLLSMSFVTIATDEVATKVEELPSLISWIITKVKNFVTYEEEVSIPEVVIPEIKKEIILEEIPAQGFFSKIGSGINSGYTYSKDTVIAHPYCTAFIVAGVATAVVAAYVLSAEEENAEEII